MSWLRRAQLEHLGGQGAMGEGSEKGCTEPHRQVWPGRLEHDIQRENKARLQQLSQPALKHTCCWKLSQPGRHGPQGEHFALLREASPKHSLPLPQQATDAANSCDTGRGLPQHCVCLRMDTPPPSQRAGRGVLSTQPRAGQGGCPEPRQKKSSRQLLKTNVHPWGISRGAETGLTRSACSVPGLL